MFAAALINVLLLKAKKIDFFLFGCAPYEANSKVQSCNLLANNAVKFQ